MDLTVEMMWQALIRNDQNFDGVFYYSVKSTGIFCRPSCKSKVPRRENVSFFFEPHKAIAEGYRPCKRCRPDLLSPPAEPIREMMNQVTKILQTDYVNSDILADLPTLVHVSPFHLQRSFKKLTGATPKEFLRAVRIEKAKELLAKGELNNTEICYAIGFQSISGFYAAFRDITGVSPREYKLKIPQYTAGGHNETCI